MSTLGYLANPSRSAERQDLAETIWRLPYSRLEKYGITSYREITGLDIIGIPIWIAHRPLSSTISVTAGKNPDRMLAAVGSITEAIEFWASEQPQGKYHLMSWRQMDEMGRSGDEPRIALTGAELLDLQDYPLARDNVLDENTPIAWEMVEGIGEGMPLAWMPSHLIWLKDRVAMQFLDVQQSSNGLASGTSQEDALLQALYELVERDGWTINYHLRSTLGLPPVPISLVNLPPELAWSIGLIRQAGLWPMLFDCTQSDLHIPVCGCALFGRDNVGLFGGYGAHLSFRVAAQRAIIEAVQSRLCYISGARDDLYRRDFIVMKQTATEKLIRQLENLPTTEIDWELDTQYEGPIEELRALVSRLNSAGIKRLYFRTLAQEDFGIHTLHVVKAIAPQLEGVHCEYWRTNGRATAALAKYMKDHGA